MVTTCSICGTTEEVDPGKFIDKSHFAKWLGNHV